MKKGDVYETKDGYYFQVLELLPKNSELNKKKKTNAQIVHVKYSMDTDFRFALGKYFKLSRLKEMIKLKHEGDL